MPEIYIKPRDVFTKNKVKENLQRILSLYRASGRYAAIIEPKIIYLEQNRVDVVFEINEGPASKIQSIKFEIQSDKLLINTHPSFIQQPFQGPSRIW